MRFEWSASGWHRKRQAVAGKSRLHRWTNRWTRILQRREWQSLPTVFDFYVPAFRRVWNCGTVFLRECFFKVRAAKSWRRLDRGELPESGGRTLGIKPNGMWKFVFYPVHKKLNAL